MRIQTSKAAVAAIMAATALMTVLPVTSRAMSDSQPLDVTQLVQVALEVNPQVRAARARWESAEHSTKQAYAPNDPQLSFTNGDSAGNGFNRTSYHTLLVSEAFQFPGKALLQGDQARRSARDRAVDIPGRDSRHPRLGRDGLLSARAGQRAGGG